VTVTAEVDTEPSAYAVLERTIIESSQIFPQRNHPAPLHVGHLGLDASWFPEGTQLMTTDAVRLVIVTVAWHPAPTARKVALAVAVARSYLGRSRPKLARGPAPGGGDHHVRRSRPVACGSNEALRRVGTGAGAADGVRLGGRLSL
jgi:hypothetical protein